MRTIDRALRTRKPTAGVAATRGYAGDLVDSLLTQERTPARLEALAQLRSAIGTLDGPGPTERRLARAREKVDRALRALAGGRA